MSALHIALESAAQPEVVRLIGALDAYQQPLYPPESHHGIDLEALGRSNVLFAVARAATRQAVGCGAIVLGADCGELKRMWVNPDYRGQGIGRAVLDFLEREAARRGCRAFVLETGHLQAEALALYEHAGYVRCGAFGDYVDDPHSVFMRKSVAKKV
ncbi:MAG: GNAT family N-acetyltransferase [Burkholderiaceae bacterium]